jgi:ATP-GRASP peptide maturase of grasp-with-spasm system
MIFIVSEKGDLSTQKVVDYLRWKKASVGCRFEEDFIEHFSLNLSNESFSVSIEEQTLDFGAINYWYRRGDFTKLIPFASTEKNAPSIGNYLGKEWVTVKQFLHWNLEKTPNKLGSFDKEMENNKLWDLKTAKEVYFHIPHTLVTTSKKELQAFKDTHQKIITKSLKNAYRIETQEGVFLGEGTQLVEQRHIDDLENYFFPLIVQSHIEKLLEIRVFYLQRAIYAMAIFSQENAQTKIDYRYYDEEKPNRNVPFLLPKKVSEKLIFFMESSNLETGSIDLIMTPDEKFVFLEVNPVGQFDWLSTNCNYYLEEKIADYLIQNQL